MVRFTSSKAIDMSYRISHFTVRFRRSASWIKCYNILRCKRDKRDNVIRKEEGNNPKVRVPRYPQIGVKSVYM